MKKKTRKRIIGVSLLLVLLVVGFLVYQNFNRLLSEALRKNFNSHVISDVYELTFKDLQVNVLEGSIRVMDVSFQPRVKPLRDYPYINSSFSLKTAELNLENVAIFKLLQGGILDLEKISITRPDIDVRVEGRPMVLFPFSDSSETVKPKNAKKTIDHFLLRSFELVDAAFHVRNEVREREFRIEGLSISWNNLLISQRPGQDSLALEHGELSISAFDGRMRRGPFQHVRFSNFSIAVDSLAFTNTVDTVMYKVSDAQLGVRNIDIQTKDSLFHLMMRALDLSYRRQSMHMGGIKVQPNQRFESMQEKVKYLRTDVAGSVGTLHIRGIDLDSLVYARKLFVESIDLDTVELTLYTDHLKPRDPKKKPMYLGQTIAGIPLPMHIKKVRAEHVHLIDMERKPDSAMAEIHLTRAVAELTNITTISRGRPLVLSANALLAGKVQFAATLSFDYRKPQFKFEGLFKSFSLPDLNPVIEAYTPARITKGVADLVSFSGVAEETKSSGTMEFRYHDLEVDINLKKKANWKSSVLTFTANTALHSSNPPSASSPPRIVTFHTERHMDKGFINLVIKSALTGLKETMFMSKENRKAYKEAKRKAKD